MGDDVDEGDLGLGLSFDRDVSVEVCLDGVDEDGEHRICRGVC